MPPRRSHSASIRSKKTNSPYSQRRDSSSPTSRTLGSSSSISNANSSGSSSSSFVTSMPTRRSSSTFRDLTSGSSSLGSSVGSTTTSSRSSNSAVSTPDAIAHYRARLRAWREHRLVAAAFRASEMHELGIHPERTTKNACLEAIDTHIANKYLSRVPRPSNANSGEAGECLNLKHKLASLSLIQQNLGRSTNIEKIGGWQVFCHGCAVMRYIGDMYPLYPKDEDVEKIVDARKRIADFKFSSSGVTTDTPNTSRLTEECTLVEALNTSFEVNHTAPAADPDVRRGSPTPSETGSTYIAASLLQELAPVRYERGLILPRDLPFPQSPLLPSSPPLDSDQENRAASAVADSVPATAHRALSSISDIISISSTTTERASSEVDHGRKAVVYIVTHYEALPLVGLTALFLKITAKLEDDRGELVKKIKCRVLTSLRGKSSYEPIHGPSTSGALASSRPQDASHASKGS
ncbi:hypothetical protein C8F01DRAFT_1232218 [Mycena amicta]|nr:hypothetical protein C8F01DRAFT_1232218 [Mycena amicta]